MNTRAAAALLLMICVAPSADLAAQAPPSAPDWSATFGAEAMKAHQRGAERHVVVPGDANAKEAAAALAAGLRAAGAPLVMDSAALGDTNSPEDSFLLAKASPLPVELVWIVRVYPGAQPYKQSAALLVYEHSGAKLRDANTQRGESRHHESHRVEESPMSGAPTAAALRQGNAS